jgi:hypothetical protein
MATMTEKRKLAAKRKKARELAGQFKEAVFTSASLNRAIPVDQYGNKDTGKIVYPGKSDKSYGYVVQNLRLDEYGNLIADAGCDDTLVCTAKELPSLVAFLTKLLPA